MVPPANDPQLQPLQEPAGHALIFDIPQPPSTAPKVWNYELSEFFLLQNSKKKKKNENNETIS